MEHENLGHNKKEINFYVIAGIVASALIVIFLNSFEPQIDSQLDFFEFIYVIGWIVPAFFSFLVAKRYWGSKVFGKAYFALGIAFSTTSIGAALFDYFQMYSPMQNPYPYYPDLFFWLYYPFAIYHLSRNTLYFNRGKIQKRHIAILVVLPLSILSIYVFGELVPVTVPGSVPDLISQQYTLNGTTFSVQPTSPTSKYSHIVINNDTFDLIPLNITGSTTYPQHYDSKVRFNLLPIVFKTTHVDLWPKHDQTFYNGFYTGVYYVTATTATFAWAVIAAGGFRKTDIGAAWGLLLAGLGLISVGDISYYYTSIYSYDRSNPVLGIYLFGCMITCYALYLHKKPGK